MNTLLKKYCHLMEDVTEVNYGYGIITKIGNINEGSKAIILVPIQEKKNCPIIFAWGEDNKSRLTGLRKRMIWYLNRLHKDSTSIEWIHPYFRKENKV